MDDVIIVGSHAKKPLVEGFNQGLLKADHVHVVETTAQALTHVSSIKRADKVIVLLENDLPDQYF